MKILFLGDIVGKSGRQAVTDDLAHLRGSLGLDFVIANGENAAHGFGLTEAICEELYEAGVDVITGGNHSWDRPEIIGRMARDNRILRPVNYPPGTPGRGADVFELPDGRRVLVLNLMCRLFMELLDDPFQAIDRELPFGSPRENGFDAVVVDVHGEATSEKMALGHIADGRATLVVGTHTHVPTADTRILDGGTAYQTDAGMCGDYNSVIGMHKDAAIANFLRRFPRERLRPAEAEGTLCGVVVEADPATGLARQVSPLRQGGVLAAAAPSEAPRLGCAEPGGVGTARGASG